MSEQMFQVVETYEGVTRVKMVGSYKKCKARLNRCVKYYKVQEFFISGYKFTFEDFKNECL